MSFLEARVRRALARGALFEGGAKLAPLVLLLPLFFTFALDLRLRATRLHEFSGEDRVFYLLSGLEAAIVWATLLGAATARGVLAKIAIPVFLVFFTIALGGQTYFFEQYSAYLNVDVSRFATDFGESVVNQLLADLPNYLRVKLPFFAIGVGLVFLARKVLRPSARGRSVVGLLLVPVFLGSLFVPLKHRERQPATPDMLYMNAMGGMILTLTGFTEQSNQLRPRARASLPVPALERSDVPKRNVVFVILESVRADATCAEFDPGCKKTEFTNALFPDRIPLLQMRALDSTTAISLAVLWSGVAPSESRDVLHTAPLLFDYARAAGYHTVYWTSQNMMFGNVRLWVQNLGVEQFVHATMIDPTADIDLGAPERLFADYLVPRVETLREPFFLTIQLSNGHYPYLVEENGPMPFSPSSTSKAPEDNGAFRNFYQNAIYQQDQHLSRILGKIKNSEFGKNTVFVVTSDHGEAFREHYQMGHTFSMFDEEVKVPAYVVAPPGTLSSSEERELRAKKSAYVFHPDLSATVLDLIGVWENPKLEAFRGKMRGESLLRPSGPVRILPMTNCAGVWSCAFENWGFIEGSHKLEARAWDAAYHCYDLESDPAEKKDLGAAACGTLEAHAKSLFGRLPGKKRD